MSESVEIRRVAMRDVVHENDTKDRHCIECGGPPFPCDCEKPEDCFMCLDAMGKLDGADDAEIERLISIQREKGGAS